MSGPNLVSKEFDTILSSPLLPLLTLLTLTRPSLNEKTARVDA